MQVIILMAHTSPVQNPCTTASELCGHFSWKTPSFHKWTLGKWGQFLYLLLGLDSVEPTPYKQTRQGILETQYSWSASPSFYTTIEGLIRVTQSHRKYLAGKELLQHRTGRQKKCQQSPNLGWNEPRIRIKIESHCVSAYEQNNYIRAFIP